jgi:PAS domain S-box-containing protein
MTRAQLAHELDEERFRQAFRHASIGMAILAPEGRILEANPAYCALTGYTEVELRELSIQQLTYPDDLPTYLDLYRRLLNDEIPSFQIEKRCVTKDGKTLWDQHMVSLVAVRDNDRKPTYLVVLVQNIDQRKRTEREHSRLASVIERASDFIGIADLDLHILFVNPAGRKLVGLASLEEARRTQVTDYLFPEDAEYLLQEVLPTVLEKGSWSGELRYRHFQTGDAIPVVFHEVFTINDPETGRPMNFANVSRDLWERKRTEQERERSLRELRALAARLQSVREEERTQVAREVHDELGQALTAIKIDFLALLRDLPAEQRRTGKAESILQLISDTIASIRRISTELRPGILDDLGLVAAVEWAAEEWTARTGTKLRLSLPSEDIAMDRERATALFRIFQETLTNVARHAHATVVRVRLAHENGYLLLEVQDNGKGMNQEQLPGGRSLGIVGMRERALLLGGELTIHTAPEEGTTVRVRIPEYPIIQPESSS